MTSNEQLLKEIHTLTMAVQRIESKLDNQAGGGLAPDIANLKKDIAANKIELDRLRDKLNAIIYLLAAAAMLAGSNLIPFVNKLF